MPTQGPVPELTGSTRACTEHKIFHQVASTVVSICLATGCRASAGVDGLHACMHCAQRYQVTIHFSYVWRWVIVAGAAVGRLQTCVHCAKTLQWCNPSFLLCLLMEFHVLSRCQTPVAAFPPAGAHKGCARPDQLASAAAPCYCKGKEKRSCFSRGTILNVCRGSTVVEVQEGDAEVVLGGRRRHGRR